MLNILINAYAVSPSWGSEPGMGWTWVTNIAKHCKVHVITEGEWKDEIEEALKDLPQKDNIIFYYNPVSEKIRKMCWNQGDWRFYWYYRKWQQKTLKIAEEIIANHQIDVIHQLNMIGFREPGYLWKIKDIPYVWGPIGNTTPIKIKYMQGSTQTVICKQWLKNYISRFQLKYGRVNKAINRASHLIASLQTTALDIHRHFDINNISICLENAVNCNERIYHRLDNTRKIKLLWVGRFIPTKRLDVAFKVLAGLDNKDLYELNLVGWGSPQEQAYYKKLAVANQIETNCIWHGKITNHEVQQLMQDCDIFLFTSILEGTPSVVLEAISNNLPVICFNVCGQGVMVNEKIGWKVALDDMNASILTMQQILNYLDMHRHEILQKSQNCEIRKKDLAWDAKISFLMSIYQSQILQNLFKDGIDAKDTLYIIGNGFDLTHGIKSSYSHFREWVGKSKKYSDLVDLMDIFFSHEHDFWSETEVALGEYDEDQIIDYCKPLGEIDYDHPTRYIAGVEDGPDCLFIPSVEHLQDAFRDWVNSIEIPDGQRVLKIANESKFLTFNYTETLEAVYGVPEQNVLHIHGSRVKKDSHYVFGHCNHRSLECCGDDGEFYDKDRIVRNIRKTMNDCAKDVTGIISQNEKFFEGLTGIKQVIVLGHSLGKVDWPYFEKVQSMVNPSARWIFTYYSDADKATINDFITNGGISHYMIVHSEEMKSYND